MTEANLPASTTHTPIRPSVYSCIKSPYPSKPMVSFDDGQIQYLMGMDVNDTKL